MNVKKYLIAAVLFAAGSSAFAQHAGHAAGVATPYAGLQSREIKALSKEDTQGLLQGSGMSLALAAELNGYPGPLHVLELAAPLGLTREQRDQTEALMHRHKSEARRLGQQIVDAERALDLAFAGGRITPEEVTRQTRSIAELQAALRASHLQTHLEQKALLTPHQVMRYQQLRGYASAHLPQQGGHR